jgi:hypothetical protein
MIAGSIAFFIYASWVRWVMMYHRWKALTVTASSAVSLDAAGAAIGSIGLAVFVAVLVWRFLPGHSAALVLIASTIAWLAVSLLLWELRKRL